MSNACYFLNNSITAKALSEKKWEDHPMGPPDLWPLELKTVLATLFRSKQPMFLFWSEKAYCFYNDPYLPTFGKETLVDSIGEEAKKSWKEIWPIIRDKVKQVFSGGEATWNIDQHIPIKRDGTVSETYWTYSYSPILDFEGKTKGVLSTGLETTEQVFQRKKLKTNEAKMRGILEGSTDYVAALDLDGCFMLFNSAMADECFRIYGKYPKVGDHISDVLGETHDQTDDFEREWNRAIKGECFTTIDSYNFEEQKRYFQISYSPIRDEDGILIGTTKTVKDITIYKNNEDALRESESSFRALSETMPQIVWTADSEGYLQYINPKGEDYTGKPANKCLGKDILNLIHRDDVKKVLKIWGRSVSNKKSLSLECRIKSKSGTYKWFLLRALPYSSSSEINSFRWVGTCTNIHNHKTLLEKLSKSEERLNLALESGKIGLWDWNLRTDKVYMSHTCSDAWELAQSNAPVTLEDCMNLVHPDDRENVWDCFFLSAHTGKPYDIDYRLKDNPIKGTVWINAKGKCFFNKNGRLSRITGVIIDITKKKEATLEMQKAKSDAESANKLKSAFLANMSHEIRTPLGVIAGFTDLLRSEELKKSEKRGYSDIVSRTTTQLSTIIDDILDLSKVEAGQLKTECRDVAVDKLIKEVVAALRVKAKNKNLTLRTELSDIEGMRVGTDPTRVSQILFNLIGNSLKFTSEGSISIEATYRDGALRIYITDTGIGIPPKQQHELFRPFSQLDVSITRKYGGTGLGLTLSKKLANALQGDLVLIKSSPGIGSTFCLQVKDQGSSILRLQTTKSTNQKQKLVAAKSFKHISGKRVLIVEDVKENQILFNKFLTEKGIIVEIAENGLQGVEKAMNGNFDCVLMDIQMPILDGYSAAKKLRSNGFTKPIIALTAHAMSEAKEQCLTSGCNDYVTKPLNTDELFGKIQFLTATN